ncbi:BQ5605_C021g09288 [Microbotryum silenes-dioicae]|uniref:BQ5605_C021g09288 protein n=1 Tax=Microbotryum silenes-dioicae TaxID=796604 RepID=A0A2X0MP17_9BASI|nr:BQ5605_C021g09288 [Microbotryum silenes-dioicae]
MMQSLMGGYAGTSNAAPATAPPGGHSTAASAIAEHLSTPSTLTRMPLLRQRIQKERASLQTSLSARGKEQIDAMREGLHGLKEAKATIETIKEGMKDVEHNMSDPRGQIPGFGKLVQLSVIHRRFTQALETATALRSMYTRLSHISSLLSTDRADPLGPAPNLLPIHYHLTELETFRNETLTQAKRSRCQPETMRTLEAYFERLSETIEAFEAHYFRIARELLELSRRGHASVAVKVAKIAEVEGARDQKAIAIRMVKKAGTLDVASRFKSLQADARIIKHYRAKVMDAIKDACRTEIERSYARHNDNGMAWLDDLDWIYDSLLTVEKDLAPGFPPDWKIFSVYVKGYHKALYDFLQTYVKAGPDAGSLLRLSQFVKEYQKTMVTELDVPVEWVTPPLLDGREAQLIEDYALLVVKKMDEWTANLMKTEVDEFVKREQPPEIDPDGQYGMQGAVILFQMLNQQIDLSLDSNQGSILLRIVQEASRVMRDVQRQWLTLLDQEYKRQVEAKNPDEVPGGLVEYVMALANDQIRSADFTEVLNNRLEPLVSKKYKTAIADKLNDAMDGYLDVAKRCVQVLIDVVFNDLKPATKALLTQSWYDKRSADSPADPVTLIVETLRDYIAEDYQTHLNPNLFELLIEDIIDTYLITYIVAIKKCSKLRIPAALDRIREDITKSREFFGAYKSKKELDEYFDVLESILTLMSASKMMVILDYSAFKKRYGANVAFVEGLLKARDDLDRSATNDIMESVKRKGAHRRPAWAILLVILTDARALIVMRTAAQDAGGDPDQPSIFSRLPAK